MAIFGDTTIHAQPHSYGENLVDAGFLLPLATLPHHPAISAQTRRRAQNESAALLGTLAENDNHGPSMNQPWLVGS